MTLAPFNPRHKPTLWLDADTGHGVDDQGAAVSVVMEGARPRLRDALQLAEYVRAERVMLTGGRPRAGWLLTAAPGWEHGAHHLDHEAPVGRYVHQHGARVEVRRAVEWFGAGAYSPETARLAWRALELAAGEAVPGLRLLASPGATGREAWLRSRTFHEGAVLDPPQVTPEVAELLRSTSGQHRIERFAPPSADTELDSLWLLDGRLMYAACVRELGTGPGRMLTEHEAGELLDSDPYARAWYRVRATVPDWWEQAGILPHKAPGDPSEGWEYPHQAGRTFETWADAAEVHLARSVFRWDVTPLGAVAFERGRPLDTWAKRLLRAHDGAAGISDPEIARMVRAGIRWMLLHSIGAWHSAGHTETTVTAGPMTAPAGDGWGPPEEQHGRAVWRRTVPLSGRAALMSHPEWSAQVWGKARVRVLWNRTAVPGKYAGALALDPGQLVSIYGDAVMTRDRPDWATDAHDSGAPGQLRVKGHLHDPGLWPATSAQRDRLMHQAEANGSTCPTCQETTP